MERTDYIQMLGAKEDEWMGVLQERRAQLEQEDIADTAPDCAKELETIHALEKRLGDIKAGRAKLNEVGDSDWETLRGELDKKLEQFKCDFEEIVYYDDDNVESIE